MVYLDLPGPGSQEYRDFIINHPGKLPSVVRLGGTGNSRLIEFAYNDELVNLFVTNHQEGAGYGTLSSFMSIPVRPDEMIELLTHLTWADSARETCATFPKDIRKMY